MGSAKIPIIETAGVLDTKRGPNQPVMDFIAELRRKAEHCDYGTAKEGFICDKIINGINDEKISERLLELPDDEVTLDKVIQVSRQVELTAAHLKVIKGSTGDSDKQTVNQIRKNDRASWKRGRSRGHSNGWTHRRT